MNRRWCMVGSAHPFRAPAERLRHLGEGEMDDDEADDDMVLPAGPGQPASGGAEVDPVCDVPGLVAPRPVGARVADHVVVARRAGHLVGAGSP